MIDMEEETKQRRKGAKMPEKICPQCQGKLVEILDSNGELFICRSNFHGKISPSFSRETLEVAQGIVFVPSQPFLINEINQLP